MDEHDGIFLVLPVFPNGVADLDSSSPHPNGFQALIKQESHGETAQDSIGLSVGVENINFNQKLSPDDRDTF